VKQQANEIKWLVSLSATLHWHQHPKQQHTAAALADADDDWNGSIGGRSARRLLRCLIIGGVLSCRCFPCSDLFVMDLGWIRTGDKIFSSIFKIPNSSFFQSRKGVTPTSQPTLMCAGSPFPCFTGFSGCCYLPADLLLWTAVAATSTRSFSLDRSRRC